MPIKWSALNGLLRNAIAPAFMALCPHFFIGIASDENNGQAMTCGDEPVLQVKAAQARHMQIGDEARSSADLLRFEKFLGRAKRGTLWPRDRMSDFIASRTTSSSSTIAIIEIFCDKSKPRCGDNALFGSGVRP